MAKRPNVEDEPLDLSPDAIVGQLHPDVNDTSTRIYLSGYLGPSGSDDLVRLYTDLSFTAYYEIARADIQGRAAINPDDNNSGTMISLKREAQVACVTAARSTVPASMLSGSIASAYLAQSNNQSGFGPRTYPPTQDPNICTGLACDVGSALFCVRPAAVGPRTYPPTQDPNICTGLACDVGSALFCARPAAVGPRTYPPTQDPNICTGLACDVGSALFCARPAAVGPRTYPPTQDPNICTGLACDVGSALFCARPVR
jgi:hypothetical protein